ALIGLRRGGGADRDFTGYLVIWAVLPFLFFSASKGKLATYLLPCFAPLSILLAAGLERYLAAGYTRAWRIAAGVVALAFVTVLALLVAAQSGVLGAIPYGAGEGGRLAMLVAGLVVGVGGGI